MSEPMVVDLRDPALWQDPYPVWRAAAQRHRTARTPHGEVIVLSADDLDVAGADPQLAQLGLDALHRLGITGGPFHAWRRLTLAAIDGEEHERLRSVVGRSFTPRRVEAVRAGIRAHAEEVLDAAIERGGCDLVAEYASPLPLWVICRFLGLPDGIDDEIATFLVGTEEGFADPMTTERRDRAESSIVALYAMVAELIVDRRRAPREDLVTDLVEAQSAGRLSDDELHALVVNIIGGAVGSSRAAIANSALLFLQHPDQAHEVRDDPGLIRPAVEECLRYHPPFRSGRRKATAPIARFGVDLAAGDTVYLARQAANRDPQRWDDPDRFDIHRDERRHHSFGYGPHFCLGQALARVDLHEALGAFLARIDRFELVDTDPVRVPFVPRRGARAAPDLREALMTTHDKLVLALDDPGPAARDEFEAWTRSVGVSEGVGRAEVERLADDVHRAHTARAPRFFAFASLWLVPQRVAEVIDEVPGRVQWFRVRERLAFDRSARADAVQPWAGIKKTTPWAPARGVDARVWQGRYTNHGAVAAVHHATVARYRQNVVDEASDPELRAISELWWTNAEDLVERFYASDAAEQLVGIDAAGFVDASRAHPTVTTHEVLRIGGAVCGDEPFLVPR